MQNISTYTIYIYIIVKSMNIDIIWYFFFHQATLNTSSQKKI